MKIDYYVFSGTGNTLLIAAHIAEKIVTMGHDVALHGINVDVEPDSDSVIGVAFPVAFFSYYPVVLDFFEKLPVGNQRKIFITGTMGGCGMGLEGWFRKLVAAKGYIPIASELFVMPGNYNNQSLDRTANDHIVAKALIKADVFAAHIADNISEWKRGSTIIPSMWHKFVTSRLIISFFYRMYPIQVCNDRCVMCMRCASLCPADAFDCSGDYPKIIPSKCQCCQRCAGFCPVSAITVTNKTIVPYSAVDFDKFKELLNL